MQNNSRYIPISCSYYDVLEAHATKGDTVQIELMEGLNKPFILQDQILTLETCKGEEFVILKSGRKFRLDAIQSVNGVSINEPIFDIEGGRNC